jgi:hypothetical protein
MDVWQDPFVPLRLPKIFNLRSNPFERADKHTIGYDKWKADRLFQLVPAQKYVGGFLATFKEFQPSQKVGSFSLDQVMETLQSASLRRPLISSNPELTQATHQLVLPVYCRRGQDLRPFNEAMILA